MTIDNRCNKAVELSQNHEKTVYWCNFNDEGDLIEKLDDNAYQIKGSMKLEKKEELLLAFADGEINKLITDKVAIKNIGNSAESLNVAVATSILLHVFCD